MYTKVISFNTFLYDSTNLKANAVLRSNPSEFHLSDFFSGEQQHWEQSFLQVFLYLFPREVAFWVAPSDWFGIDQKRIPL